MLEKERVLELKYGGRYITTAQTGDPDLGPLKLLPGTWANRPNMIGRGWNLIALPFPDGPFRYRLLMNQYNESLRFMVADKGVPNRGVTPEPPDNNADQFIVALDYEQTVEQIAVADFPETPEEIHGVVPKAIHHEPGLFLHMTNKVDDAFDVARLGTIPHGDSLLALGTSDETTGPITFPDMNGLPIGTPPGANVDTDVDPANPSYLDPYKHFHHNPFKGTLSGVAGFPGFEPVDTLNLLRLAAADLDIVRTMVLDFDTTVQSGGILNIPFIVAEANATEMRSIFWLHELNALDEFGNRKLVMQYAQLVMLDFFPRRDGQPGLIKWPHISINTMEKVSETATPLTEVVKYATAAAAPRSIV